mmetsp:Transcript_90111/g.255393  ORF Transcript_90111/g.255393 Transcript_90111/m.255393 type:complete len:254 (-) Transcript_90111:40-801(-)
MLLDDEVGRVALARLDPRHAVGRVHRGDDPGRRRHVDVVDVYGRVAQNLPVLVDGAAERRREHDALGVLLQEAAHPPDVRPRDLPVVVVPRADEGPDPLHGVGAPVRLRYVALRELDALGLRGGAVDARHPGVQLLGVLAVAVKRLAQELHAGSLVFEVPLGDHVRAVVVPEVVAAGVVRQDEFLDCCGVSVLQVAPQLLDALLVGRGEARTSHPERVVQAACLIAGGSVQSSEEHKRIPQLHGAVAGCACCR